MSPTVCGWPVGPHWDVLITFEGETWCMLHDDDMLPELVTGMVGGCVLCGKTCTTWIVGEDPGVCLHEACRRERALRRLPRKTAGAYARREAQR